MALISPINDITLVWDEINDDDFDRYEVWRAPYLPISAVVQGSKQFKFTGMLASWFEAGDTVLVTGSTGNDGSYTIDTSTESGGITTITVLEAIPSSIADGYIGNVYLDQLAAETKKGYYKDRDMPVGFYYYVIFSINDKEIYSDPSSIIQKFSPMDVTPPATPTGLVARRNNKYTAVELTWNALEQHDLKGYIVRRTLDPYAGTPTWETIAFTGSTSNKFTDNEIPINADATYQRTDVAYYIEAYDKDGNVSAPTSTTAIFTLPTVRGVRVSLDYLNLNVYWDEMLPEDGVTAVAVLLRIKGNSTWTFMGISEWPKNFFRISQELLPNTDYELAVAVVKSGVHPILEHNNPGVVGTFEILGDYTTEFPGGGALAIYDSANLDGPYNINSSSYSAPNTTITTAGAVPAEYVINGVDLTRNYITISGDHVADFQDKKVLISIFGSTGNDGRYRVLSTDLYLGSTRLFLQEALADTTPDGNVTSGTIVNLTELLSTIQLPIQLVPIPDYVTDITEPTAPILLTAEMDPQNERTFLNWSRVIVEDDFLEFHVEINILGGDFPITVVDQANDHFTVAGDQTTYFYVEQKVRVYGSTGNDDWYDVVNVVLNGGNTEVYVEGNIPSAVADGKMASDLAWFLLDKTKNTNFQAYFPYVLNPGSPVDYWFRVRSVDRSGNKSIPESCITSITWRNPDLNGAPTSLLLPQWIDYTSQAYTTFKDGRMRRHVFTVNPGNILSNWFKNFVLYFIQMEITATPQSYFNLTPDEIFAITERNTFTWETFQFSFTITGVSISSKYFEIDGDLTGTFVVGYKFSVYGSTGNDGTYTVLSRTYTGGKTRIFTVEAIANGTVDGIIGHSLYAWPAIEDVFGEIWMGPVASITRIDPT